VLGLTLVLVPLAAAPLELQRRIVDHAVAIGSVPELLVLGGTYLGLALLQNTLKYVVNVTKGRILEDVAQDIRRRVVAVAHHPGRSGSAEPPLVPAGSVTSIIAAEAEDVAGFASESLNVPLLQGGTILAVLGYLLWVEPLIALLGMLL
jgi:ABC-type multidrug transport system fused ATPase/permease subunit